MTPAASVLIRGGLCAGLLAAALAAPLWLGAAGIAPDFTAIDQGPSLGHPFGTDGLGRDVLARALRGLGLSLAIAGVATVVSGAIALAVAFAGRLHPVLDAGLSFVTDAMLALPHLLVLILLAFAMGGGAAGLVAALALSHWPRLARILRAEARMLAAHPFVEAARAFGKGPFTITARHILPHLLPQWLVGVTLLLPHAVLHEAALTFAGFGLEPSTPALGVMLAEAMRHLAAGRYWLAVGPGLVLLLAALLFESFGRSLQKLAGGQA